MSDEYSAYLKQSKAALERYQNESAAAIRVTNSRLSPPSEGAPVQYPDTSTFDELRNIRLCLERIECILGRAVPKSPVR